MSLRRASKDQIGIDVVLLGQLGSKLSYGAFNYPKIDVLQSTVNVGGLCISVCMRRLMEVHGLGDGRKRQCYGNVGWQGDIGGERLSSPIIQWRSTDASLSNKKTIFDIIN